MARTHCSINAFFLSIIAALCIGLVAACENTARGLKQDAKEAEAATRDDRAKVEKSAADIASDAAHAARTVGNMAADAGEQVAERASALKENVDVKAALMADPSVDASRLDVDVDYRTRTLSLNGYVPTQAERDRAETIAKKRAPGYRIVNNVSVRPR